MASKGWNKQRPLTDEELLKIIENFTDSEDELEVSESESIIDFEINHFTEQNGQNDENIEHDITPESEVENVTNATGRKVVPAKIPNNKIIWKKQHLIIDKDALTFRGQSSLSTYVLNLDTPYNYFKYFFTDELIKNISEESNLYSAQKNPNKPTNFSSRDIEKFLGICLYMSVITFPRTRSYWRHDIGVTNIKNAISINDFESMKSNLHFNNNTTMLDRNDKNFDSLHKIRPVITELSKRFSLVPMEHKLSIDEQICATKTRHHLKQYNPMKPHKWGFKLFMLCGTDGYSYNFEIYQGSNNIFTKLNNDEPDLGSSANIVTRLARGVPKNVNHQLYCDNYYTSIPLFVYMAQRGIYMLGTIRKNRIPNNKLMDEKDLQKKPRGTAEEYVATMDDVNLSLVAWKDNKIVNMLSTCYGEVPISKVKRFDKRLKEKIEIDRPNVITEYNYHMGGVDLLDSYIGRYKIPLRSKKWYLRIFFHLVDIAVINAWLLYKRAKKEQNESSTLLNLWQFRLEVAECLCLMGDNRNKKRGRPSNHLDDKLIAKHHKASATHIPPKNVRLDQISHWINYDDKRQRCKLPQCKGYTHFKCEKCSVHLCLTKEKNYFKLFHA